MQPNRVLIKIFVFCLAFLLGFSISKCFNLNIGKNTSDEIERKEIKKPIISFAPKEIKHNLVKHQCKKYFDCWKYNGLLNEQLNTHKLLIANKQLLRNEKCTAKRLKN